jgi:COMPASS component SWD1
VGGKSSRAESCQAEPKLVYPCSFADILSRNLILSSSDRALRILTVSPQTGDLLPIHRFQDLVNRTPWNAVGFSGDGEYVMGGAGHKMAHNVFVWDREAGALVKVLEGPREPLLDCAVSDPTILAIKS